MARELLGNGQAITGLLGMLTSWEEPVRLAAVRALAKVCWQVSQARTLTMTACKYARNECVIGQASARHLQSRTRHIAV